MKRRQIVDEEDNLTGHKSGSEIDYDHEIYRVSALWLTNPRGEILLAQRSSNKDDGATQWGPAVAGTVEEGETYESNIYKEAEEEIGLRDVALTKGLKMRVRKPKNYFCQWFTATIDREAEDFSIQEDEVAAVRWISVKDLLVDLRNDPERYLKEMGTIVKLLVQGATA